MRNLSIVYWIVFSSVALLLHTQFSSLLGSRDHLPAFSRLVFSTSPWLLSAIALATVVGLNVWHRRQKSLGVRLAVEFLTLGLFFVATFVIVCAFLSSVMGLRASLPL